MLGADKRRHHRFRCNLSGFLKINEFGSCARKVSVNVIDLSDQGARISSNFEIDTDPEESIDLIVVLEDSTEISMKNLSVIWSSKDLSKKLFSYGLKIGLKDANSDKRGDLRAQVSQDPIGSFDREFFSRPLIQQLSNDALSDKILKEQYRAQRYMKKFTIAAIKPDAFDNISEDVLNSIEKVILDNSRVSDEIYRVEEKGCFLLVLCDSEEEACHRLVERINNELITLELKNKDNDKVQICTSSVMPDPQDPVRLESLFELLKI